MVRGFTAPLFLVAPVVVPEDYGRHLPQPTVDEERLKLAQEEVARRKAEHNLHKLNPYEKGNNECD